MKIVVDLMRNIFIIMFICLVALEVIVLISLIALYKIPLERNQPYIEIASMNNTQDVLNSFNYILQRKYYNLETDLLLIAKHLYPMYLSEQPDNPNYPAFQQSSKFYTSYGGCLLDGNLFNSTAYVTGINQGNSDFDLMEQIFSQNQNFSNSDEENIIDTLFLDDRLNKIINYPDINPADFSDANFMEKYVCYAISIFKTILIRDTIFEKVNLIIDSFYLFLNQKYIYRYPMEYLDNNTYPYLNYFHSACNNNYTNYENCFRTFSNFDVNNGTNVANQIYFDPPLRQSSELVSRGCINVPFPMQGNNFACIDFSLTSILSDIPENDMSFYLISYEKSTSDFVFYYSSDLTNNSLNVTKFKNTADINLGNFALGSGSTVFSLFYAIYDEIFGYQLLTQSIVDKVITEYSQTVSALKSVFDLFEANKTICDSYLDYQQNIALSNHFLVLNDLINANSSEYGVKTDKFQFVLFPIKLNYTEYNNQNYIFENNCSANILYYSLLMVRVGTVTIPENIYLILVLKCIRSFFFFISVLLFANIIYFVLCEIYVKYLIYPIKYIHQNLEKLIKSKISSNTEELGQKDKDIITDNREALETKETNELRMYRNLETQKLEDLLNFLRKIVIMKQAHGYTDYKVKSKIYAKFLTDAFEQKHYRQCLFIIAYSMYKDQAFADAYQSLNLLKKHTLQEEAELLSKNDNLEQKIINLPSLLYYLNILISLFRQGNSFIYLNEFTENETSNDQELNKLIKLRIFSQKISYLYGLVKYLDFFKRKQDLKDKNIPKSERIKIRREDHRLLEEAIVDLNNSLSINTTMNLNQIKSIFTLILIAKCNFYNEKYTEASNDLKKALLKFSDLNKYFFEKNLWEQIDPRVMFIINGVIIEQILFNLGRVCEKLKKKQLAGWIFNKMMEISYFRSNEIYRKACNKLKKFFEIEKENSEFINCKNHLEKISRRLNKYGGNKKICIIVSENLLKHFNSSYELREVLLKCIEKYILEFDMISYLQIDTNIQSYITEAAKVYNFKIFKDSENFCKYSGNIEEKTKINFYKAMNSAINILSKGENNFEISDDQNDKYIFTFLLADDFRFSSSEENKSVLNNLIKNKISLYNFFFDEFIQENKILKIKKYLKDLIEGFVITVKNFKIIKQAFQNISNRGGQKNILHSNFENHKYIL